MKKEMFLGVMAVCLISAGLAACAKKKAVVPAPAAAYVQPTAAEPRQAPAPAPVPAQGQRVEYVRK